MELKDEVLDPEEHPQFPGYYKVPGNPWIVINRSGECKSARTGTVQRHTKHNGYRAVCYREPKDDGSKKSKVRSSRVHRLLGLTFIGRPARLRCIPVELLQINHKNHNKWDCSLTNLEWVTDIENTQAASEFGVMGRSKKVLSRDIRDNKITIYSTISHCGKQFGIGRNELADHLASHWAGRVTHDWQVFKFADESLWPELPEVDQVSSKWFHEGYVTMVKENDPNHVLIFNGLVEVAEFLNVKLRTLCNFRNYQGVLKPYKGWIIAKYDTVMGHDTRDLGEARRGRKLKTLRAGKLIRITDTYTSLSQIFVSINEAARTLGVVPSTIVSAIIDSRPFAVHFKAEYVYE